MNRSLTSITVFTVLVVSHFAFSVSLARAQVNFDQIEEAYVGAAFSQGNERLRKFSSVNPLTYNLVCATHNALKCATVLDRVSAALSESAAMKSLQVEKGGKLQITFASKSQLDDEMNSLKQEFRGGSTDARSSVCQLYVSANGDTINRAAIVVSLDIPNVEIETCLLISFYRSLGLSLADGLSFSTIKTFTQDGFSDLKRDIDLLVYVHSCPKLLPGMTRTEVQNELNSKSDCLRELRSN